jgi:hypothetical protein
MTLPLNLLASSAPSAPTYVDDVFSTYLYTGNGSTQTITNGIDLAGKGGMVWIKQREGPEAQANGLFDTSRGTLNRLVSEFTDGQFSQANSLTAYNSNGFSLGSFSETNLNNRKIVSWTFRKAAKFFDIQTYTGNGASGGRQISHSLGIAPGMVIIKKTSAGPDNWYVWHRGTTAGRYILLNDSGGETATVAANVFGNDTITVDPTSTYVTIGNNARVNENTSSYVMYCFAHDTTTDGIVQCGSWTTDGSGNIPDVTLGWEPQYYLVKNSSGSGDWRVFDSMRNWIVGNVASSALYPSASYAEGNNTSPHSPMATGLKGNGTTSAGVTYIYLAIRRPNKPPTSGTQVYNAIARTGTGAVATITGVGFAPDLAIIENRSAGYAPTIRDKLRGIAKNLDSTTAGSEFSINDDITALTNDGAKLDADGSYQYVNWNAATYINWFFRRAVGVFDIVCYTGTGSATTVTHGLGAVPELIIVKGRSSSGSYWRVYCAPLTATKGLYFQSTSPTVDPDLAWNSTTPTASVFSVSSGDEVNVTSTTYVAYLFATKAGISKVGSYTGNGSNQNIECGFAAGARFVMIKRTDSSGNWNVFDSVRGIIAGDDPALFLNNASVEATYDSIDPYTGGFNVVQEGTRNLNVTSATYIYLAFA